MPATVSDILIERGATFKKTITVLDSNSDPIDISIWSGAGKIKSSAVDTTSIVDFTFDFSQGASGKVTFSLTDAQTDAIVTTGAKYSNFTKFVYDVELDSGTDVYRALNGNVNVSPSVTR